MLQNNTHHGPVKVYAHSASLLVRAEHSRHGRFGHAHFTAQVDVRYYTFLKEILHVCDFRLWRCGFKLLHCSLGALAVRVNSLVHRLEVPTIRIPLCHLLSHWPWRSLLIILQWFNALGDIGMARHPDCLILCLRPQLHMKVPTSLALQAASCIGGYLWEARKLINFASLERFK